MKHMSWLLLLLSANVLAAGKLPSADGLDADAGTEAVAGPRDDDKGTEWVPTNTGGSEEDCRIQGAAYRDQFPRAIAYAPADRGFSGTNPGKSEVQADININKDNTAAVVSYKSSSRGVGADCGGRDVHFAKRWSLTFTFPINDEDAGFAEVATLDGLASGYSVEFERNWSLKPLGFVKNLAEKGDFRDLCARVGVALTGCLSSIRQQIAAAKKEGDTARAEALQSELYAFMKKNYSTIREYGITAGVGHDSFDYLTPQLGEKSVDRLGWRVGASMSFITPSRQHRFSLGANYGRSYRPGREVTLCPPSNGTDPVECVSGRLGPPSGQSRKVLWTEARGGLSTLGYSLKIAHDFETDTTGVDLPIYLLRNADGALTGGIRFGWNSEEDTTVGIFLSSPFEL